MPNLFNSTKASLWDSVSKEYEDLSYHGKNTAYPGNHFRYEIILDFLATQSLGSLLDAGCGPGLMTRLLQKKGWQVTACDYSLGMLKSAKEKAKQENLPDVYRHLSLQELSQLGKKFDIVLLNGVLPYISEKEEGKVFSEIKKVLKPKGIFIASHYNLYFDFFGLDKWSVKAVVENILKPAGLPASELEKAQKKIESSLKNPNQVLDKEKTMKLEDPLSYKDKLKNFGFQEFDQAFYNFFYLPAKFEAEQDQQVRGKLEKKLRRNPRGLLLARGFVSFAYLQG